MGRKSPGADQGKCKAPPRRRPPTPRPAIADVLREAANTADLPGACCRGGYSLAEVMRACSTAPELDALLQEARHAARISAAAAIETAAAGGDLRAIRALTDGTVGRLDPARSADVGGPPPDVAAAMLAAGIRASLDGRPPEVEYRALECPCCKRWIELELTGSIGLLGLVARPAVAAFAEAARRTKT